MRNLSWLIAVGALSGVWACDDTVGGQKPVGGSVDSEASIQRYLRRASLDLSGKPPSDADLATQTAQLRESSNTAVARGTLVDGLIAKPEFAALWTQELENALFAGNDLAQQYQFVCSLVRADPGCTTCTAADACECSCPQLQALKTERTTLMTTATDFAASTSTGEIERRYAKTSGYFALIGSVEQRVSALFTDFLARTAEADEIENGRMMIFGSLIAGSPAGLMFHREGASYDDLLDIVFTSEVYREAIVRRVFLRYLAREPSTDELAHFVPTLDAMKPDARPVLRAVLSSREYFEQ